MNKRASAAAAATIGAALMMATAASAKTARSVYPSKAVREVRDASAWASSTSYGGLCVQALTCPSVTNATSGGGVGGPSDAFLGTSVGSILGVGGTSTGTWQSKPFTYRGAAGRAPKVLTFRLFRRTDDATFLRATGSGAYFSVAIVKAGSAKAVAEPVHRQALSPRASWTKVGPRRLVRHVLRRGKRYRLRVTSTFVNGATVMPGGSTGYDNFELVAKRHLKHHRHHGHHRRHHR